MWKRYFNSCALSSNFFGHDCSEYDSNLAIIVSSVAFIGDIVCPEVAVLACFIAMLVWESDDVSSIFDCPSLSDVSDWNHMFEIYLVDDQLWFFELVNVD